ncbi:MAG: spore coat protein [Bacillota bacterium]
MNTVEKLQDVLNNEMQHHFFYNEESVRITDKAIRQLFMQLRDDKMRNITLLQTEIDKIQQGQV